MLCKNEEKDKTIVYIYIIMPKISYYYIFSQILFECEHKHHHNNKYTSFLFNFQLRYIFPLVRKITFNGTIHH